MKYILKLSFLITLSVVIFSGCASKKRKKGGEPSKLSKFYHNTTALYNGYFNANELLEESYMVLRQSHQDDYTQLLPLYDYVSIDDPKAVYSNLDKAIEKVTTVAALHEPSKWVDDCYVLMGEAQYLKQEYETAEETFAYFKDEFNPDNPFGRNYKKKKKNKDQIKKEREEERKKEKKEKEKKKKEEKEAKEDEREAKKKAKEEADKARKRERERKKKEREDAKKKRKKSKKRGGKKKRPPKKKETPKTDENATQENVETDKTTGTLKTETKKVVTEQKKEAETEEKEEAGDDFADNTKEKEKKKKDKTAYSKGMMWYAKTLVQRDKLSNASYLVKRMKEDGTMPDEARREVPVILADINIREKNYSTAIDYLEEAIELAKKKSLKARYAFVQGQLYMKDRNYTGASEAFKKAKKWAKSFEMEFMAELNAEKTQMIGGSKSDEAVIAKLDKMINEDKYAEYLDQLYFTKGEILLEKGNFDDALKSFSRSIANNVNNLSLKQETYYRLAYLLYDKEQYVSSKLYFDSTLTVLEKEDSRYKEVSNYSENLAEVANNIQIIKLQDSLLNMTTWSDEKIEEIAAKMVEENIIASKSDGPSVDNTSRNSTALLNGLGGSLKTSTFFAYDPMSKQRGQKTFKSTWGDVELTDNWRRSDKSGIFGEEEVDDNEEKVPEDGYQEDEIAKMVSTIKSQIPYSDVAKVAINGKIQKAMFDLGKAYRDKIQKYEKAADTHKGLLSRYPDFENKLDVYYYLYLSYLDLNDMTNANIYKDKILAEFPDTEFAKAISDPNFGASKLSEEEKLNKYYEETYELFQNGDYSNAKIKAEQAESIFGKENVLKPKFALVKAMSIGNVEGKGPYIAALKDLTTRYPNTPEKARADEILRFLQGDKDAFTGIDMEEVDELFSAEDSKLHYVAVVLYNVSPSKVVESKINISNYNKKYHKLKKLQLGESQLDREQKSEIVLVRRFENKAKAMEYYDEVAKSKDEFIKDEELTYNIYPITQRNYRKMIIERSDARYKLWFEKNYLGK